VHAARKLNYLMVMPRFRDNLKEGYFFPFGIPYISAALKKAGFAVFTLNLNHVDRPYGVLKNKIIGHNIDIVLTGSTSADYHAVKAIVDKAKAVKKSLRIICGGGLISGDPVPAMTALKIVDFGVIGEGEITIVELCRALEKKEDFFSIKGIIYKQGNSYEITPPRPPNDEIDSIPWPDYDGFDYGTYLKSSDVGIHGLHYKHAAMFLSSRSCPYNCTFCFHTIGKKFRQRSLDDFFAEVDHLVSHYEIDFFYTHDEFFTYSFERAKEFCERMGQYNIPWQTALRVDSITDELLEILKRGNCKLISFGFESADNSILKSMNKNITVAQIERALEKVVRSGISFSGAFIFGDKDETLQTANNTLKWWQDHRQYNIVLKSIFTYPGSELYKYALENKIIKDPVAFLKAGCPVVNVSKMSNDEFNIIAHEIALLEVSGYHQAQRVKLELIDASNAFCTLRADCHYCGAENQWSQYRFFTTSFGVCKQCKGRQRVPLPDPIFDQIEKKISLLASKKKIALWGMANHAVDFLERSTVVRRSARIFLVDNSEEKQGIILADKKVCRPAIIGENDIQVVVIFAIFYFATIKSQVESIYPNVKVLPVYDLYRLGDTVEHLFIQTLRSEVGTRQPDSNP
jgi:anaerobic magnesium-protoporphyrin IX monomethyl ester cyclase